MVVHYLEMSQDKTIDLFLRMVEVVPSVDLEINEYVLAGEMAAPLHIWNRHGRQPRRYAHRPSSRKIGCTCVGAGRCEVPAQT